MAFGTVTYHSRPPVSPPRRRPLGPRARSRRGKRARLDADAELVRHGVECDDREGAEPRIGCAYWSLCVLERSVAPADVTRGTSWAYTEAVSSNATMAAFFMAVHSLTKIGGSGCFDSSAMVTMVMGLRRGGVRTGPARSRCRTPTRCEFENDYVKVVRVHYDAGVKLPEHTHPSRARPRMST